MSTSGKRPLALFVQPFSMGGAGGGARILRSMISGQPFSVLSVNSTPLKGESGDIPEIHCPIRPALGRIDYSRFHHIGNYLEFLGTRPFAGKLSRLIDQHKPDVIHVLPHAASDFHIAWQLAMKKGIQVVMSVHDDLVYSLAGHPLRHKSELMLGQMWREVSAVFVISKELGEEYSRRYGPRGYTLITDGVETIASQPRSILPNRLHVYFMGLFHYSYSDNLRYLARELAALKSRYPAMDVKLTMRCAHLPRDIQLEFPVEVLPYSDQAAVERDMQTADVVYMPLQFDEKHTNFVRYSLSTKMVTYLASGLALLYHGPRHTAAVKLLQAHDAAFLATALHDRSLEIQLQQTLIPARREVVIQNALALARESFDVKKFKARFLAGLFPG